MRRVGGLAAYLLAGEMDQRPVLLSKPLLQFHTQYNAALPWDSIDMDFMNLNQEPRTAAAGSASSAPACASNSVMPATGRG